jgi:hypothetical protein
MATPSSTCVYPLSPTYLVLHRYLYYTSLILSVLYPTPPPLVKGAFAYSLTYSSTAALYAILVLALPLPSSADGQILNLDIFGLWAVLAPASILLLPLLTWSRSLHTTARPIIRIWGILILIGASCTFALLHKSQQLATATTTTTGALNCSALAASAATQTLKLRDPNHVLSAPYAQIFTPLYTILTARLPPLTFIPLAFGAFSSLLTITAPLYQDPSTSTTTSTYTTSYSTSAEIAISDPDTSGTRAVETLRTLFLTLRRIVLYLTPYFLIPVLVVNEMYLLKDWPFGVPEAEKVYEVGQWGLLAGLGLVSAAAGVNWVAGSGKESGSKYGGEQRGGMEIVV